MAIALGSDVYTQAFGLYGISGGDSGKSAIAAAALKATVSLTAAGVDSVAEKPQTLEEFKGEFRRYLDSIEINPALSGTPMTVNISDAAFERMMNEPEFKEKIISLFERDMCDPAWSRMPAPAYMNFRIEASGEEYLATSWGSAHADAFRSRSEGAFWSRNRKSGAAAEKAVQRKEEMRRWLESLAERKRLNKAGALDYYGELLSKTYITPLVQSESASTNMTV